MLIVTFVARKQKAESSVLAFSGSTTNNRPLSSSRHSDGQTLVHVAVEQPENVASGQKPWEEEYAPQRSLHEGGIHHQIPTGVGQVLRTEESKRRGSGLAQIHHVLIFHCFKRMGYKEYYQVSFRGHADHDEVIAHSDLFTF
ncbi:hypothetical protein EYF80_023131 [Liparis tanakae]|uniref:Uncharacterized protein n=1 Tax=Liparis tanakae TaxID=230148 RepID=A0A4Z2HLH3_9TELE|nr:hypothetical protein EYF80_023131 [Liparis tanakae]